MEKRKSSSGFFFCCAIKYKTEKTEQMSERIWIQKKNIRLCESQGNIMN